MEIEQPASSASVCCDTPACLRRSRRLLPVAVGALVLMSPTVPRREAPVRKRDLSTCRRLQPPLGLRYPDPEVHRLVPLVDSDSHYAHASFAFHYSSLLGESLRFQLHHALYNAWPKETRGARANGRDLIAATLHDLGGMSLEQIASELHLGRESARQAVRRGNETHEWMTLEPHDVGVYVITGAPALAALDVEDPALIAAAPDRPGSAESMDRTFESWMQARGIQVRPTTATDVGQMIGHQPDPGAQIAVNGAQSPDSDGDANRQDT